MKFETIGRVSVRGIFLQVGGQVDDVDGFKRTLFHANTASNAQLLAQKGNFVGWTHFNTQFSYSSALGRWPYPCARRGTTFCIPDGIFSVCTCLNWQLRFSWVLKIRLPLPWCQKKKLEVWMIVWFDEITKNHSNLGCFYRICLSPLDLFNRQSWSLSDFSLVFCALHPCAGLGRFDPGAPIRPTKSKITFATLRFKQNDKECRICRKKICCEWRCKC